MSGETQCVVCGDYLSRGRWELGYRVCLFCGEEHARQERMGWCIAPINKSNYTLITDPTLLKQLNPSVKREPEFAVGEVVMSSEYGKGIVREVDSSGYLKIVFESDEHNWAAWWFTPATVTKLHGIDWIGE